MSDDKLPFGWVALDPLGPWKNKDTCQEIVATDHGYKISESPEFVDDPKIYDTLESAIASAHQLWHRVKQEDYCAGTFAIATMLAKNDGYDIMVLRGFGDQDALGSYTPSVDQYIKDAGFIDDGFFAALNEATDIYAVLDAWVVAKFNDDPDEFKKSPQSLKDRIAHLMKGNDE